MPAQTGKIKTYMRTQSTASFKAAPRAHGLTIRPREAGDYGYQKNYSRMGPNQNPVRITKAPILAEDTVTTAR